MTFAFILFLLILYFTNENFEKILTELYKTFASGNKDEMAKLVNSYGLWGVVILISLMVLQLFLVVFPSWLPMIIAALVYGFIPSILISVAGVFLASTLAYVIGLSFSENALKKFVSEKTFDKLDFWVSNYGFGSVVIFRISPFLSNDGVSLLAGTLRMDYIKFISATLIGITPLAVAIALFSHSIESLKIGLYVLGGFGILVYGIFIYLDYKKRKNAQKD